MWWYTYLFLLFVNNCTANKLTVPVFLLDYDNVMSHLTLLPNPFVKMDATSFNDIITDAIRRSACIILFTEENLSTEDLSSKDGRGTAYFNLQKGLRERKVLYIPAVTQPYPLLNLIFPPLSSNVFSLGSGTKLKLLDSSKYLYVNFQDNPDMTRVAALRKHDIIMREVYFTVRQLKPGPIIAFYTGKRNPVEVESLHALASKPRTVASKDMGVMIVTADALFRLSGVFALTRTRRLTFKQKPIVEDEKRTRRAMSTSMQYSDFQLQFNFRFGVKKWELANVALLEGGEEVGRTRLDVSAPWNRSFFCAEPLVVVNVRDGSSITVSRYQIQPIFRSPTDSKTDRASDGEPPCFGDVVNCSPYFNAHILMGLFIVLILTLILTYGIQTLFNCKSNDKLDDANQKPLQVVQETG